MFLVIGEGIRLGVQGSPAVSALVCVRRKTSDVEQEKEWSALRGWYRRSPGERQAANATCILPVLFAGVGGLWLSTLDTR